LNTLIPRRVLFGNPERVSPRLSPDGTRLAWIAPRDRVLNVWVAPASAADGVAGKRKNSAKRPGTLGVPGRRAGRVTPRNRAAFRSGYTLLRYEKRF
jgi:hypothetical protein